METQGTKEKAKGALGTAKAYHEKVQGHKLMTFVTWGLRVSDYVSDAALLIALMTLIINTPHLEISFPKLDGATINITYGYNDGSDVTCYSKQEYSLRANCQEANDDGDGTINFEMTYDTFEQYLEYEDSESYDASEEYCCVDYTACYYGFSESYDFDDYYSDFDDFDDYDYDSGFDPDDFDTGFYGRDETSSDPCSCSTSSAADTTYLCYSLDYTSYEELYVDDVSSSAEAYEYLGSGTTCDLAHFQDSVSESDVAAEYWMYCSEDNEQLTPWVVYVDEQPWNCYQSSGGTYTCQLSDDLLINVLMALTFVVIGKEILVLVNYKFLFFEILDDDLNHLSADSIFLIAIWMIRILKLRPHWFERAYKTITDNRFFFSSWMMFDFGEKLASASVTAVVLFNKWNFLAFFAFATTFFGFVSGLKFWRQRAIDYFYNVHFSLGDEDDDAAADEEADDDKHALGIGVEDLEDEDYQDFLPAADADIKKFIQWETFKMWFVQTLRICAVICITGALVSMVYLDYVDSEIELKIQIKLVAVLYFATILAEYATLSNILFTERLVLSHDISHAYVHRWGRFLFLKRGRRHATLVKRVDNRLTRGQYMQYLLRQKSNLFLDFVAYPLQILAVSYVIDYMYVVWEYYTYHNYCDGDDEQYESCESDYDLAESSDDCYTYWNELLYVDCNDYTNSAVLDHPNVGAIQGFGILATIYAVITGLQIVFAILRRLFMGGCRALVSCFLDDDLLANVVDYFKDEMGIVEAD